jgi:hypothetical protein
MNQISEPLGVLPLPATRPAPQAQPGTGLIAKQEVVVGGKTFDANQITVALPQQRIAKEQLPSIEDLQDRIQEVAANVREARDWYHNVNLDEFWLPVKESKARIAELEAQLAAERAKLAELKPEQTPKMLYVDDVAKAETKTTEFARLLIAAFADEAAQKQFGVSYDKLSQSTKADHLTSMQTFGQLRKQVRDDLVIELGRAAAGSQSPPRPPAAPVQAVDDGGSDREVTCPHCGESFVPDYQSDAETGETGGDDEDNGDGDDLDAPSWDNAATHGLFMAHA